MNFKTTILLLIALLIVGGLVFLTGNEPEKTDTPVEKKLIDVASADVTRVSFTGDDGRITLERADTKWTLVEPVKAPAADFAANGLIDAIVALKSKAQVPADAATGLDKPHSQVEFTTRDGKTHKFDVGSRSSAGDNLYIKLEGQAKADVVPASLMEQLQKPLKDWRRDRLFDVASNEVKQLRVATTQQSLAMEKVGEDWKLTKPSEMPLETFKASDMAMAASNLRAVEFVSESATDAKKYGLDQPVMTVQFSTQAPTTQPSTQPTTAPSFTTIQFGRFEDLLKTNVYAAVAGEPGVFKVAASTMDAFKKDPLDLRDRKLLTIDPEKVTKLTITAEKGPSVNPPAPAKTTSVVLERTKKTVTAMGPTLPATLPTIEPSTMPATTQAATQPAPEPSKWNLASSGGADAEDSKVDALLTELNPLRVEKFIASNPTTQPAASLTMQIETTDARYELTLTDPGSAKPLIGGYNGLTFEVGRHFLEKLDTDFARTNSTQHETHAPGPTIPPDPATN